MANNVKIMKTNIFKTKEKEIFRKEYTQKWIELISEEIQKK